MLFFNFFYMKVILKSDVPNLGDYGDIKIVANGYARNFLIPRKLATPLTSGRAKEIELIQAAAAKVQKARHEEMKAQIKKIAGLELEISAKSQKNKLFGSITAKNTLMNIGLSVDTKKDRWLLSENPSRNYSPDTLI